MAAPASETLKRKSPRRGGRGDRCSIIEADAAEARQLDGWVAQVEARDQAQKIDFDALDPAELHPEEAPQRGFDTRAAIGQADIGIGAEIFADGVGRKRGLELGHRAQHGCGEGVAVGAWPDAVVAEIAIAVVAIAAFTRGMSAEASGPRTSTSTRGASPNQRPSGAQPLLRTGWPQPTTS